MFSRIDQFTFIRLSTIPHCEQKQWQMIARAGVPGLQLWDTGQRGRPFQLQSFTATYSLEHARELYRGYTSLTALGGVEVEIAGESEPGTLYHVLAVDPVPGQAKAILRGHLAGDPVTYRAILECVWTLLPLQKP